MQPGVYRCCLHRRATKPVHRPYKINPDATQYCSSSFSFLDIWYMYFFAGKKEKRRKTSRYSKSKSSRGTYHFPLMLSLSFHREFHLTRRDPPGIRHHSP
ncbi:unnamed protein product [Vicia faba]|uniref:Uncharacterized protein n=1 Tax=Vicia faba TaxID=3906 RepID=A0AAV0YTK6_VICFA|nr:unnamed protein product [Vicia faba]